MKPEHWIALAGIAGTLLAGVVPAAFAYIQHRRALQDARELAFFERRLDVYARVLRAVRDIERVVGETPSTDSDVPLRRALQDFYAAIHETSIVADGDVDRAVDDLLLAVVSLFDRNGPREGARDLLPNVHRADRRFLEVVRVELRTLPGTSGPPPAPGA